MKIWIDDVRPAPDGYVWCKSVEETKNVITTSLAKFRKSYENGSPDHALHIELIDLDMMLASMHRMAAIILNYWTG